MSQTPQSRDSATPPSVFLPPLAWRGGTSPPWPRSKANQFSAPFFFPSSRARRYVHQNMAITATAAAGSPPRLLDQVRQHLRVRHYSIRTEQAYVDWIRRFILFHRKRHPGTMAEPEITSFLTHLAADRNVAASTQNQALSALLFLYQHVFERKLDWLDDLERVKRPPKVPVVLTSKEVRAVLNQLTGDYRLMAELLYGSGLRLMECLRLRVKDVDFAYKQITVRDGKGFRDR